MRLAAVVVAGMLLGCATMTPVAPPSNPPRSFVCGTPALIRPSIAQQVAIIVLPTVILGAAVAGGYVAIGGEAPFR